VNSQPVLFIQGAGSMHQPDGSGRLAAYLARELGTDYRLVAPEMPQPTIPTTNPGGIASSRSLRRSTER
jgi:hypothetical protein